MKFDILHMTDGVAIWTLNVVIQLTLVTVAALLISTTLRRSAALRSGLLSAALVVILFIPVVVSVSQWSGHAVFFVTANEVESTATTSPVYVPTEPFATNVTAPFASVRTNMQTAETPIVTMAPPAPIQMRETESNFTVIGQRTEQNKVPAAGLVTTFAATNRSTTGNSKISAIERSDLLIPTLAVWGCGVLLLFGRFALGMSRLRRLLRKAVPADDVRIRKLFDEVCRTFEFTRTPKLMQSHQIHSPFTAGWKYPLIVTPHDIADRISDDGIRMVLTHELAHAARRDPLILLFQNLTSALYWAHPLIWLLNRQLCRAREEVCDNFVLQQTDAPTYGRILLAMVQAVPTRRPVVGTVSLMNSRWKLETRVAGLLDSRRNTDSHLSTGRRWLLVTFSCCLFTVVGTSTVGIAQTTKSSNTGDTDNHGKVVRKTAHGLDLDPPEKPIPPIPEEDRSWMADYRVAATDPANNTILRAGFVPLKPQLVWGEPLTVTLTAANIGTADFEFMFGGDYRSTGRHNRIKVTVTDADGNELPDPFANRPHMGGLSSFEIVTPRGQPFTRTVDLTQFRTFTGPGQYKLTCSFAFDEPYTNTDGPRKPVVRSEFPLTILERTPDNVQAVLDELRTQGDTTAADKLPDVMTAIARFGKADALTPLQAYIGSGSLAHQTAAYSALPLIPGDASLKTAAAGLDSDVAAIQVAAADALGQFPEAAGIGALLTALARFEIPTPVRESLLRAIGSTKSEQGMAALARALNDASLDTRLAAIDGLARMGGSEAVDILRKRVESDDPAFRYKVVLALAEKLRTPIEPNWLMPILMCRRHNSHEWLDSLRVIRVWCGERALPALLSVVDYEVPWSHRNFWILHSAKSAKGAPDFEYEYDPNSQGTPEQHEQNRKLLARLKPLAAPIPPQSFWPENPVPELKTDPPIDFTVRLSTLKGQGEQPATVVCGFFKETWNRNRGGSSFRPTGPHAATFQVAKDVRALLKSEDRARESGLTRKQIAKLSKLTIPPDNPVIEEGLTLLYIWWQESPNGQIRLRAHNRLCNAVRRAVQQHHLEHVAFAAAARKIMEPRPGVHLGSQVQQRANLQYGIQRIHPDMLASKVWLDLKSRLDSHPVKYAWVEVNQDGAGRLSLELTHVANLSHLAGMPLEYLNIQHTSVRDLSPLKDMPLKRIDLNGSRVQSLTGLEGMPLTTLDISSTGVRDLQPIAGCELTSFVAIGAPITDLMPLKDMPLSYVDIRNSGISDLSPVVNPGLRSLQIENCPIDDLSPLKTVPLDLLWLGDLKNVSLRAVRDLQFHRLTLVGEQFNDLSPLQGKKFEHLWLDKTKITDLTPLLGVPLTDLAITGTPISDLTPLKDMNLASFRVVAAEGLDLSPLAGMPLTHVGIVNIELTRNIEVLRSIESLKTIRTNGKPQPVDDFWKLYDSGAFSGTP